MEMLSSMNIDAHYTQVLLINLAVAIVLLFVARLLLALTSKVSTKTELADHDNPAYGVSLAGVVLAITIMMTGVLYGDASYNLANELISVLAYGALGIVLILAANFVFDKVSMPSLSINESIKQGNLAAGLVNAGNVVATAVIIRAVMIWSGLDGMQGLIAIIIGFILSQLVLSLASMYRIKLFNAFNKHSFQDSIRSGNLAVAWRFTGFRIGVALAITAASGLVPPMHGEFIQPMVLWTVVSLAMLVLVSTLSVIADKVILSGIDIRDEVDSQSNVAIGVVQCVVVVSIGLIIAVLTN